VLIAERTGELRHGHVELVVVRIQPDGDLADGVEASTENTSWRLSTLPSSARPGRRHPAGVVPLFFTEKGTYELRVTSLLLTLRMAILPAGTVSVWAGYEYTFMPMDSTHTLPVKSWVGYGYSFVPAGILIPCPFIVNFLCYTCTFVDL
jgi:hypothetical protein